MTAHCALLIQFALFLFIDRNRRPPKKRRLPKWDTYKMRRRRETRRIRPPCESKRLKKLANWYVTEPPEQSSHLWFLKHLSYFAIHESKTSRRTTGPFKTKEIRNITTNWSLKRPDRGQETNRTWSPLGYEPRRKPSGNKQKRKFNSWRPSLKSSQPASQSAIQPAGQPALWPLCDHSFSFLSFHTLQLLDICDDGFW